MGRIYADSVAGVGVESILKTERERENNGDV